MRQEVGREQVLQELRHSIFAVECQPDEQARQRIPLTRKLITVTNSVRLEERETVKTHRGTLGRLWDRVGAWSIGVHRTRVNDADLVVGKGQQPTRRVHVNLWHMTTNTICCGLRAGFCDRVCCCPIHARAVTRCANLVVRGSLPHYILMGIMAHNAAEAAIRTVETFAVFQAIGLEADIGHAPYAGPNNCFPRTMALPAEAIDVLRR